MQRIKQNGCQFFSLCLMCFFLVTHEAWAVKQASIVVCAETGKIYHEKGADEVTHPASLTKMMTLYLTFKALKEKKISLDDPLSVSHHASKQAPSKLGLKPGSTLTVRQAILALITKSANDAAVALAEGLKESETKFAHFMTQQARKLGMTKTVFKNASGLPNPQQVTTARDMATLSRSLYKHFPDFFSLFKTQKFVHKGVVHGNHNKLLGKVKGMDGIKTGFINASGFNLAASVVRDNKRIIAVVMGGESAKSRDNKMVKLLEATFSKIKKNPSFRDEGSFDSIEDLIHTFSPQSSSPDATLRTAAYLTEEGKVRVFERKYNSVDDILSVIEDTPSPLLRTKTTAARSKSKAKIKAPSKTKKKEKTKVSPKKKAPKRRLKRA